MSNGYMAEGKLDPLKPGDFPGVSRPPSSETLFMFMNLANPDRVNWNAPRPLDRVVMLNSQKPGQEELIESEDEGPSNEDEEEDQEQENADVGAEAVGCEHRLPRSYSTQQQQQQQQQQPRQPRQAHSVPPRGDGSALRERTTARDEALNEHNDEGDGGDEDDMMSSVSNHRYFNPNHTVAGRELRDSGIDGNEHDVDGTGAYLGSIEGDGDGVAEHDRRPAHSPQGKTSEFDWDTFAVNGPRAHHGRAFEDPHGVPLGGAAAFVPRQGAPSSIGSGESAGEAAHCDDGDEEGEFKNLFVSGGRTGAQSRRAQAVGPGPSTASVTARDVLDFTSTGKRVAGTPKATARPDSAVSRTSARRPARGGPAGQAFDRLVQQSMPIDIGDLRNADDYLHIEAGTPRSTSQDKAARERELKRLADMSRPGLFNAAVASHVNSMRERQESASQGRRPASDTRRAPRHRRADDDSSTIISMAQYMHPSPPTKAPGAVRTAPRKHGSRIEEEDSDSDTDAYEEKEARLDALDPHRPPDSDEEDKFYSLPEDQFRRWRARRDAMRMHVMKQNRRRRKQERYRAEKRAKSAYIAQLSKLKLQGIPISRDYTMDDDLEDMRLEFERHQACTAMMQKVETMRRTIGAVVCVAEFILCALRVNVQGWSGDVVKELENKKYDAVLEKLYRKYWKKSTPSPEFSLALMVMSMLAMKWLQNREARARGLDAAAGRTPDNNGAPRPGIGGALSSVIQGVLGSLMGRGPGLLGSLLSGLTGGGGGPSAAPRVGPRPIPTTTTASAAPTTSAPPSYVEPPAFAPPASAAQPASAAVAAAPPAVQQSAAHGSGAWSFARARRTGATTPSVGGTSGGDGLVQGDDNLMTVDRPGPQPDATQIDPRAMAARAAEMRRRQSLQQIRTQYADLADDEAVQAAARRVRQISGDT